MALGKWPSAMTRATARMASAMEPKAQSTPVVAAGLGRSLRVRAVITASVPSQPTSRLVRS